MDDEQMTIGSLRIFAILPERLRDSSINCIVRVRFLTLLGVSFGLLVLWRKSPEKGVRSPNCFLKKQITKHLDLDLNREYPHWGSFSAAPVPVWRLLVAQLCWLRLISFRTLVGSSIGGMT